MEEHDVHVAERIHLAASVSAEGDPGQSVGLGPAQMRRAHLGEQAAEKNVHEVAALADDLASAGAGGDAQAQAVFLEAPEAAVGFEGFDGGFPACLAIEVFGCPVENFFQIVTHGPRTALRFSVRRRDGE